MGSGRAQSVTTYLLDTHVLLWWTLAPEKLSRSQREVLKRRRGEGPFRVASISLWEIATLYSLGRIKLDIDLEEFLAQATEPPLVEAIDVTPAIAAEVARLPDSFHRDPADRLIVATARVLDCALLTNDSRIIRARLAHTIS